MMLVLQSVPLLTFLPDGLSEVLDELKTNQAKEEPKVFYSTSLTAPHFTVSLDLRETRPLLFLWTHIYSSRFGWVRSYLIQHPVSICRWPGSWCGRPCWQSPPESGR